MSDGFFSRWSRLKRGDAPAPAPAVVDAVPAVEAAPEPEFDISTLPDLETATAETDFTAFLQKGVPEFLKKQALRRAWSLDPGIRDFVGPADYAWDFNAVDGVPGFSLTLDGDLPRLLAQAMGQIEQVAEALPSTPSFLPPGTSGGVAPIEAAPPVASPLRLEAAQPAPLAEAPPVLAKEEQTPRRHGGATPSFANANQMNGNEP